jgi:hypothetical protein
VLYLKIWKKLLFWFFQYSLVRFDVYYSLISQKNLSKFLNFPFM